MESTQKIKIGQLDKATLDTTYQSVLVSGTNIKTINGTSILGSGDLVVSGGGTPKRAYFAEWKLGGAMAASNNWYGLNQGANLRDGFSAIATINPTNNFSDLSIQSPCFILPFNAKIKSYNIKGYTNGSTSSTIRSVVSTAFTNSSTGATIQNALNVADVSFVLNSPSANSFRFQTGSTGLTTTTLVKGTEIRLFNFNNNVSTPLQSTIVSIEFEEVI